MSIRIEILENNTVELFTEGQEAPFIRQPHYPNGEAFVDAADARSWAEAYVESVEIAEAPYAPSGPGEERRAKPTAEEIAAYEAMRNNPTGLEEPQNNI